MKLQRGNNGGNNRADGPVIVLPRLSRRADETHGITHSTGATEKKVPDGGSCGADPSSSQDGGI